MVDPGEELRRRTADIVLYWMKRRGMTRQVFADRMGRSLSWVDKIRNGDRQLDRLSVLRDISLVLDIALAILIDPAEAERRQQCPDDVEISAIRSALGRYDAVANVFRSNGDVPTPPDIAGVERAVKHGWMAFQATKYDAIGQLLADIIRDAQSTVWQLDGAERQSAQVWLSWAYQLTAATAFKLGEPDLGWIAADRGIQVAEQTADLTLIAGAARRVAHALTATGQNDAAVTLVRLAAQRLSPHLSGSDNSFLSAYGMLLLKGSVAAARSYRANDVRDLQNEAQGTARRLAGDLNEHWSAFGTTNVLIHRVSALADMQEAGRVIEASQKIQANDLARLPRERRASHLLDLARGYMQWGKRDEAATTLLGAEQLAPAEVRCRRVTRQIVQELVRSYPRGHRPGPEVIRLAKIVGVAA